MSEKIKEMIANVLKHEGGYSNHPEDKGGPTNLGVTQDTLSAFLGYKASIEDVKRLTVVMASDIYEQNYYLKPKISLLPDAIQPIIFDIGVNSGPKKAVKMLQEVLNKVGFDTGTPDGIIGNGTAGKAAEAANRLGAAKLINLMVDRRISFYNSIVERNPSQKKFINGWLARAESFRPDDTGLA